MCTVIQNVMKGKIEMTYARGAFLVAAIIESIFAIPFIGGILIVVFAWTPLSLALIIHIVALVLGFREKMLLYAPIMGILASILGFIPLLGWMLHVITAILYIISLIVKYSPTRKTHTVEEKKTDIKDAEIIEDDEPTEDIEEMEVDPDKDEDVIEPNGQPAKA